MNDQAKLLRTIQNHSFAVTEAALYLDNHPKCRRALRYYEIHRAKYLEAVSIYEKSFGPITMYNNDCRDSWKWAQQPWPWES